MKLALFLLLATTVMSAPAGKAGGKQRSRRCGTYDVLILARGSARLRSTATYCGLPSLCCLIAQRGATMSHESTLLILIFGMTRQRRATYSITRTGQACTSVDAWDRHTLSLHVDASTDSWYSVRAERKRRLVERCRKSLVGGMLRLLQTLYPTRLSVVAAGSWIFPLRTAKSGSPVKKGDAENEPAARFITTASRD